MTEYNNVSGTSSKQMFSHRNLSSRMSQVGLQQSRPPTTASGNRGYNYFYDTKVKRNLQSNVNRMDAFMKKNNIDSDKPANTLLTMFAFVDDYNKYVKEKQSTTIWKHYEEQWSSYIAKTRL
jgi:hypothetical protein